MYIFLGTHSTIVDRKLAYFWSSWEISNNAMGCLRQSMADTVTFCRSYKVHLILFLCHNTIIFYLLCSVGMQIPFGMGFKIYIQDFNKRSSQIGTRYNQAAMWVEKIEILEGNVQKGHIHFVLSFSPKNSISEWLDFWKGKVPSRYLTRIRNWRIGTGVDIFGQKDIA